MTLPQCCSRVLTPFCERERDSIDRSGRDPRRGKENSAIRRRNRRRKRKGRKKKRKIEVYCQATYRQEPSERAIARKHYTCCTVVLDLYTMAIIAVPSCLGPPPLPPGKRFQHRALKKMSSTYHSFRDPAVEAWIPNGFQPSDQRGKPHSRDQTRTTPTVTNNLYRSCSEGHLNSKKSPMLTSTPLDKCIKAIYGSWRNLMQRKSLLLLYIHVCIHLLELDSIRYVYLLGILGCFVYSSNYINIVDTM